MRQTLFYLPTRIGDCPIFGNGILFWAIVVAGLIAIARCAIRRRLGDAVFYAAISAVGLFVVRVLGPNLATPEGFPIRGYGAFLTLALVASTALTLWRGKRKWNYPSDVIFGIVFVAAIFGILGARAFYVAQYWNEYKSAGSARNVALEVVNIANGGLVVYGAIIGGSIAVALYLWKKRLPVLATLDLFTPALLLGIAIGRIGCFMNGCCFGGACDKPWGVVFPKDSPAYLQQLDEGVVSLYGITLEAPNRDDEKTLFGVKSSAKSLATETPGPIRVASVDPGSDAEAAGVAAGMQIVEVGLLPKGAFERGDVELDAASKIQIQRFRPSSPAQLFYFFTNMWNEDGDQDVWLVAKTNAANGDERDGFRNFVFHPRASKAKPVHPSQIYSALAAFAVCCVLLVVARFVKRDGVVFSLGLILYPIVRFCMELLRSDEKSFSGTGLTISQCVSVCVLTLGLALFARALVAAPQRALDGFFPATNANESTQTRE